MKISSWMRWVLACWPLVVVAGCTALNPAADTQTYTVEKDQVYVVRDGRPLLADVYIPAGPGPFPGVIVIHGGGWYKGKKEDMDNIAELLADNGFTAINISYRFAPDYKFPAQIFDAKKAVRWTRANAAKFKVNPERLGAFGYSAGAHLAMMLAVTSPADELEGETESLSNDTGIQAVVAGGTPVDLLAFSENDTLKDFIGGYKSSMPWAYRQASPIHYVDKNDPPTFLYHGEFDWVVDVEQSRRMVEALEKAGVPVEYSEVVLGHVATFLFNDEEVMKGVDFLKRYLQQT